MADRITNIVEALVDHEISKKEAVALLKEIFDNQRKQGSFEFIIESVCSTVESDHCIIKAKLPYGYSKVGKLLNKGGLIDVSPVY